MKRRFGIALGLAALLLVAAVLALNHLDEGAPPAPAPQDLAQVQRGEYLARVGHCAGCHTARGGADYAGGSAIVTPFGTVYSANLTPDPDAGLGRWTQADFWRALHNGRSADGRLLAPACPYPNFSQVMPGDVADLFAYLRSRPAVKQANRPHALRFPYGTQAALAVWRALYFRPGGAGPDPRHSAEWNRGAYLVGGLGHCGACHGSRNAWGATDGALDLRGGEVPMQGWLAPALDDPLAAGVADWPLEQVVALLKTGISEGASVSGPMAMVVARSTQFISDGDLHAIASYLKSLPAAPRHTVDHPPLPPAQAELGALVYERHCAGCHGKGGEGAPGAVPALAGNRALAQAAPDNLLKVVLGGAFAPATAGNPRPYGMPPFATLLSDDEVAAVISLLRNRWGGAAGPVTARDVNRARGG
jgi:mono/diheme cytochrome c family protein